MSYTRSSGAQMWLYFVCMYIENVCLLLKFPIYYNSFLIEPKGESENRVREREYEKRRLKERKQREKSIDEAISLLLPGSSASRLPLKHNYKEGGMRRKRKEKSEKEDAEGEKKWMQEKYTLMRQCFNYLLQRKHCTNNSFKHILVWTLLQPTFCKGESAYNSLTQQIQQCYRLLLREGDTGSKNTVWTVSFHLYLIVLLKNGTHAHNSVNVKQTNKKKVH